MMENISARKNNSDSLIYLVYCPLLIFAKKFLLQIFVRAINFWVHTEIEYIMEK